LIFINDICYRWNDKSLTFAIFANGYVGSNIEHTACDATVSFDLC